MIDWLKNKKTYIIAILIILEAIIVDGVINGDWGTAMQKIMAALGLGALRAGVSKSAAK